MPLNAAMLLLPLPVHRFLMALSFENLLKGLIITHGKQYTKEFFKTHNMNKLLSEFDPARFKIDKKERALLLSMEKTIRWKGRYPIPLEANNHDMFTAAYSAMEMQLHIWLTEDADAILNELTQLTGLSRTHLACNIIEMYALDYVKLLSNNLKAITADYAQQDETT